MKKKTIILSGVNLFQGGTLKIMQDAIEALSVYGKDRYRIIALVHDEKQYHSHPGVEYLSFPRSRRSWLWRLYHEYVLFYTVSKKYKPCLWFSLHDASPRVKAEKRAVYCHHSAPFYTGKRGWRELWMEPSFVIFCFLYKWFYRINLTGNDYVVVQQEWMRKEFARIADREKIIVSPPEFASVEQAEEGEKEKGEKEKGEKFIFFYPSVPRVFKNFETIGEAVRILHRRMPNRFRVFLTLDGTENRYASWIRKKYGKLNEIGFTGLLPREAVEAYYRKCDCVLFPSKLESWGLPLSEAKSHHKPVVSARLPYALETIGEYEKTVFFNPEDARELAFVMEGFIRGKITYDTTCKKEYESLYAPGWKELFDLLLNGI